MHKIKAVTKIHNMKTEKISKFTDNYSTDVYKIKLIDTREIIIKFFTKKKSFLTEYYIENHIHGDYLNTLEVGRLNEYYYIIRDFFQGRPLSVDSDLTPALVYDIGKNLARFHETDSNNVDLPVKTREEIFNRWLKNASVFLSVTQILTLKKIYECYFLKFSPSSYSLTHMDFRLGNILAMNGHFSTIIDFEKCKITDKYFDFPKIKRELDKVDAKLWSDMLEGYSEVDKKSIIDIDIKIKFYDMLHCLGALSFINLNNKDTNTVFFRENFNLLNKYMENFIHECKGII